MNDLVSVYDESAPNQYPIWIGFVIALVMVSVSNYPFWWILYTIGLGMNGLVMAGSGWKMPVRQLQVEGIRHTPMLSGTPYKYFGDIIPTGFGKASLGDIFIAAGILGVFTIREKYNYATLVGMTCVALWMYGWSSGFRLFKKWNKETRKDARKNIPIVTVLLLLGWLFNVRGCSFGEMRASAANIKEVLEAKAAPKPTKAETSKWRSLGKIDISPQFMQRLKLLTAEADKREQQQQAISRLLQAADPYNPIGENRLKAGTRQGPFCRVTCSFHHGVGVRDVEVDADVCRAGTIPEKVTYVWGWETSLNGEYEYKTPWPGPAGGGLDSYKIYWK